MDLWIYGSINLWFNRSADQQIKGSKDQWINGSMDTRARHKNGQPWNPVLKGIPFSRPDKRLGALKTHRNVTKR